MKKILVLDLNGTSAVYTHYLSEGIKGVDIDVSILGRKKEEFLDVFDKTNEYFGVKTGLKLFDYMINWCWLIFNFKKYDLVIVQWMQFLKYSRIETYLISYLQSRIKLLYIVHNLYPHNSNKSRLNKRYNHLYRTCKNIAVHTKAMKQTLQEISPNTKIVQIQHGLFFKEFRTSVPIQTKSNCLLIGYISKYKGAEDAIEIVKKLKEKNIFVSLEIIGLGSTSYVEMLNELIKSNQITDRVSILSKEVSTRFLIDKIRYASMLWLPYKNISQSGVAYTAMGLGVPIVAYDVGNFKEAYSKKGIAEVVERDNLEAFALSVQKVLENNEFYREKIREFFDGDLWDDNEKKINDLF